MSEQPRNDAGRGELLQRLVQAGARVQRELSRDEVLHRACEALEALGLRCSIAYPEGGGVRVQEVHLGEHLDSIETAIGAPIVGPVRPFTPVVRRVWEEGGAYTDRWPEEVSAFMGVPLAELLGRIGDGGFTRGIGVRVPESGAPGLMIFSTGAWLREEDVEAFRLFAEQLGASLDAAQTVARLRERNSELAALNQLAALAAAAEELGPMLDAAIGVVEEATGASAVGIALLPKGDADPRRVHASAGNHAVAAMMREFPLDDPLFREVMSEGKVRVGHGDELPRGTEAGWHAQRFQTYAVAPLRFRGDPIGLLAIAFRDHRDAAACHVELLGAMSGQLAAAIENHDLLESRARRISELTLLNDVAAATVALDPTLLLDSAIRRVCATFRADGAAAYVEDAGRRRRVATVGFSHSLEEAPPPTADDPTSLAVARKTALRWPGHIGDTPRVRWFRDREGVRSAAAVPMLAKDRTVGCFVLARRSPEPFTDEDLRLLSAVGVQLGVAVDNARLYEDLRRSYAALGRAQEQLIQQERLAALGQLAAVIAHEVRNPLGVIFNSLGSLRRMLHPRGDPKMLLDIIGEEADRLNRIVGDLLDFARPAPVALRPEPLDRVIDDAAQSAGLGPRLRFERDVAPGLPPVPMDARLVRQALLNLFTNAVQAMPAGGTLSIAARLDGDSVRIDVSDTGDGITEDVRHRIFEPFFTTRPTGTGLGLAVVKRILDDHRGSIRVEAGDPVGTRFVVRLPLSVGGATREVVERTPRGE
jgi:signal transduction histidine kinase